MPKASAPKRKAANGYTLAESLPVGEVLQDISKKQWVLGPVVGHGGFGAIYSARAAADNSTKYSYVVKIEPHSNGPLFVEMHFYMRNAKKEDVEEFKKKQGYKSLGMPIYIGSGSHEYHGQKYRFIVMEQFGKDLWKTFLESKRVFPASTVFKISLQMLDVLEYIHSKGFVHADLKGANILMGVTKDTANKQMYLIDFGLATKYTDAPEFKPNPKKAHDGTIEYLSRDAHQGVQTRRGDLEILAYNIIQWLGCTLPWEKNLKDPKIVQKSKEEHMSDIPKFMKTCFTSGSPPAPVVAFVKYLLTLKYNSKPDYKKLRDILSKGMDAGDSLGKPFNFSVSKSPKKTPSKKTPSKRTPSRTPTKRRGKGISVISKKGPRRNQMADSTEEEEFVDDKDSADDGDEESFNFSVSKVTSKETPSRRTPTKVTTKRRGNGISAVSPKRRSRRSEATDSSQEESACLDSTDDSSGEPLNSSINKVPSKRSPTKKAPSKRTIILKTPSPFKSPTKGKSNSVSSISAKRSTKKDNLDSTLEEKENWDEEENSSGDVVAEVTSPSRRRKAPLSRKRKPVLKKTRKTPSPQKTSNVDVSGYTSAMREILQRKLDRENLKKKTKARDEPSNEDMGGYNDAMKEIALKKNDRVTRKVT